MSRLKTLLPTLKEKKRYLAFEVISKGKKAPFSAVSEAIWTATLSFTGSKGAAEMGIHILSEKYKQNKGLIRVTHNKLEELKASLPLVTHIQNEPVIVRSLGASGILAKAEAYL